MATTQELGPVGNGASRLVSMGGPYIAAITVEGVAPILFHGWSVESVASKARAGKNTSQKKSDDLESYVYRDADGNLGIPGANFHGTLIEAGRYQADPRSPRKSARDLIKAGIAPLDIVAPFEGPLKAWDFVDQRRVTVQRSGITRMRPGLHIGWRVTFRLLVNLPEYVAPSDLQNLIVNGGRLVGLCDFRPSYGRFSMVRFEMADATV